MSLSRERFLKIAGLSLLPLVTIPFGGGDAAKSVILPITAKESLEKLENDLQTYYGIQTGYSASGLPDGYLVQDAWLNSYSEGLMDCARAIIRYPYSQMLSQNNVAQITFVSDLYQGKVRLSGTSNSLTGQMWIVRNGTWSDYRNTYTELTFHHEAYHLMERTGIDTSDKDYAWIGITGDKKMYYHYPDRANGDKSHFENLKKYSGFFINKDAQLAPWEDRAITASFLMDPKKSKEIPGILKTRTRKERDILLAKIEAIKGDYFQFSNGAMNKDFWDRLSV